MTGRWIPEVESRNRLIAFLEGALNITAAPTPGGSDTYIQFNDAGILGGATNLVWIKATGRLGVGTPSPDAPMEIMSTTTPQLRITHTDTTDYATFSVDGDGQLNITTVDGGGANGHICLLPDGNVGIGTTDPLVALDMHHNPTGLSNDTGGGDVVTFGAGPGGGSTTAGKLYYLAVDGQWELADADAPSTGGSQLLAIALGTTPGTHGMLIRGFFDVYTNLNGTFAAGKPVYVCPDSGEFDIDAPGDAGDFVRVVGYCTSTANVIYFNPSSTYIELA